MGLDVASIETIGLSSTPGAAPRPPREVSAPASADRVTLSGDVPASPPPEVLEAMDAAARVARELHARGRELRFITGEDGLRIELRDLDGNVLRTIPPTDLLEIASGAPLE